jgi:Zn-finger nucleic acid-binding protein
MTSFSVIGSKYLVCPECQGAWVSHPTLLELMRHMRLDAELEMWTVEDKRDDRLNTSKAAIRFSISKEGVPAGELLLDQQIIRLGKLPSCHVHLDHQTVRPRHAVIEFSAERVLVGALGSKAPTYVNGEIIDESVLHDGDLLRIGKFDLRIALPSNTNPPPRDSGHRCPTCNGLLSPQHIENINVDVCDTHGVWFDAKELESVLHRISSPGKMPK